jgi:hypothetical protein
MTVIQTNKYLIFSCDELTAETEEIIKWYNSAYDDGDKRRVNENSTNYEDHYREVKIPYTQLHGSQQIIDELFATGLDLDTIKEIIIERALGRGLYTNLWGESKVVFEGDPRNVGSWYLWADDIKQKVNVRRGDKNTYKMTSALAQVTRQVVGDDDDQYPLETYHFDRGAMPDDLHLKPNLYLVCDKVYLKQAFDKPASFMGLTTLDDGKEVIRIADNYTTIQQIVAQDNGANSGGNPPPTNNNVLTPDNSAIQAYNEQIKAKMTDFQTRITALNNDADEQLGYLMSIEKDGLPEVTTQINLIFQVREWMKEKEKLKGDSGDPARKANNHTVETRNMQLIQEWENDFIKKRAAVKELEKIFNRFNNPDTSEDNSTPNDSGQQKPNGSNNQGRNTPPQKKHLVIS